MVDTYTSNNTYSVKISPVDINKTIVLVSARNATYNTSKETHNPMGYLKSSTELILYCTHYDGSRCYYDNIFYQIIEFY